MSQHVFVEKCEKVSYPQNPMLDAGLNKTMLFDSYVCKVVVVKDKLVKFLQNEAQLFEVPLA